MTVESENGSKSLGYLHLLLSVFSENTLLVHPYPVCVSEHFRRSHVGVRCDVLAAKPEVVRAPSPWRELTDDAHTALDLVH